MTRDLCSKELWCVVAWEMLLVLSAICFHDFFFIPKTYNYLYFILFNLITAIIIYGMYRYDKYLSNRVHIILIPVPVPIQTKQEFTELKNIVTEN